MLLPTQVLCWIRAGRQAKAGHGPNGQTTQRESRSKISGGRLLEKERHNVNREVGWSCNPAFQVPWRYETWCYKTSMFQMDPERPLLGKRPTAKPVS